MLEINNLHCKIEGKSILNGINLKVNKGEIHAIMGPNGSGKSTLANVISGHEDYEITKGNIYFKSNEINELSASERAHEGIFMSFQYPIEIPGLTVTNFIKTAKSKGLSQKIIIRKHVLKESILPIIDYLAPASAGLMTGSIIIEQIFGLPGIGRYFVVGALQRDYTLVSGVMILYATLLIILILFSDILRAFLDPRVKLK